jgi:hypothetical protein
MESNKNGVHSINAYKATQWINQAEQGYDERGLASSSVTHIAYLQVKHRL